MQRSVTKSIVIALIIAASQRIALANGTTAVSSLEQAVVSAVQQEAKGTDLKSGGDLCIGFGHGLTLDEKAVLSKLKRSGLRVHPSAWCVQRGRGLSIAVLAPINETSSGTFELTIQVGDPSIQPGEHFATLLKRGTYVVRSEKGSEPQIVSYRQTCCPKPD